MDSKDKNQNPDNGQQSPVQETAGNGQADTEAGTQPDENGGQSDDGTDAEIKEIMDSMTLEEKVCQLFMVTPGGADRSGDSGSGRSGYTECF